MRNFWSGHPAAEITVDGRGDERGRTIGESPGRSPARPVGQYSLGVWCSRAYGIGSGGRCQEENRRSRVEECKS
jgi:hypothetical protein